ncbi:hypothetical protein H6G97_43225 [Nostoc flagelliforme FACHB-838]|uniref:Uncharacterized protein n=1 Tax=Nostoc flagelliforme FACHB-838 TaxID=2692904 RepID=A0ABR8E2J5_9NOSO|nr:hypothetical protein [Nostoc flagelliforme]MBD2535806.1 hypothetical protein [Nostoc flagelliforme FACHB-838]
MLPHPVTAKKATISASHNPEFPNSDITPSEDPASAIIDVAAVEVPELTEQEQSDKPDGMATLTACIWSERWNGPFLRQERH